MNKQDSFYSVLESALADYQLTEYTIGRVSTNDIQLDQEKISKKHAKLLRCSANTFLLEDLDSKNGTYINGLRISRKLVDINETVQLANNSYLLKDLILTSLNSKSNSQKPILKDPLDFVTEFEALKQVYEQYPQLRKDCRNREKLIRTGSIIFSSIIGVSAALTVGGTLPVISLLSGAGLGMLIPALSSTFLSTEEKLELIDKEYRDRYRCPNPDCRDPFGNREWEWLAKQKKCPKCKAIWMK